LTETYRLDPDDAALHLRPRSHATRWALVLVALAVAVAVATWFVRMRHPAVPPAPVAQPAAPAPQVAPQPALAPAVDHPIESLAPAAPAAVALPALDDSDAAIGDALRALMPGGAFEALVYPSRVARRIVATVDNLPRATVAIDARPVRPVSGPLAVTAGQGAPAIGADNAARYAQYVSALASVDSHALVAAYARFYPLLQQAYRDLGYPDGYFNDRLVAVLDHLLAAPQPQGPVALVQPKVLYEFADPALESLSAGQKIMVRLGPDNEARVKAKLAEIRRLVATQKR
jgi:DUF3014 family protein